MIKELPLNKLNTIAKITLLTPENLSEVLALQDETRAALPETQKMFVLPQKSSYFQRLLNQDNGLMVGVRVHDQLVAQMALMGPVNLSLACEEKLITRNEIQFHHADASDTVVVAKSMTVHPNWRGHELSAAMLDTVLAMPMTKHSDHIFAQISADNVRSWDLFLRSGFGIIAGAVDPVDNKARFIMQKPSVGFSLHHTASENDMDHVSDFAAIVRLTQREALIGRPDAGVAIKIAFYASVDQAASWTDIDLSSTRAG